MMLFDTGDLPEGNWPLIAEADHCLQSIRGLLRVEYDLTEGRGSLTNAGCMEFYRQLVVRRILDLTDAISLLWKAGLQVPCLIQVRALLETVIGLNHFIETVSASVERRDWKSVHDQITRAVFSSRDKAKIARNELTETTNILTQIRGMPEGVRDTINGFYEQISDYCHPNGYAMFQRYADLIDFKFLAMSPDHKRERTFQAVYNTTMLIIFAESRLYDISQIMSVVRKTEPPLRSPQSL